MNYVAVILGSAVGTSLTLLIRVAARRLWWRWQDRKLPEALRRA